MDFRRVSEQVLTGVGGKDNIKTVSHCMTRLRLVLNDDNKADVDSVKNVAGVLGVAVSGGQFQVVIGMPVQNVYDAFCRLIGWPVGDDVVEPVSDKDVSAGTKEKVNVFNALFKIISGIIFPIIAPLTAAGIVKGLLAAAISFHLMGKMDGTYRIINAFADGFFYFLPIIIGVSAAKFFKSNPYVAATIGAALVYPDMVQAFQSHEQLFFLHLPVVLSGYANSIFPVMLATFFAARLEHWVEPKLPAAMVKFTTPLVVLLITVPLTFLVIGPIMTSISALLAEFTTWIYGLSPILTGVILGAFWQVIVIFGLHYAFIPILINNITTLGHDPINAILNVTVFALAGSAIGFALRAKKKENKALGFSTGLTGLLGVTEPIIYGIALPYKRPFVCAFIGGAVGGGITAGLGAVMYSFGANALFAAPLFINPDGIDISFTAYLIASLAGFLIPLILTYLFGIKRGQEI